MKISLKSAEIPQNQDNMIRFCQICGWFCHKLRSVLRQISQTSTEKKGGGTKQHAGKDAGQACLLCILLGGTFDEESIMFASHFRSLGDGTLLAQTPAALVWKVVGLRSELHAAMMKSETIFPRPWETNSQNGKVREAWFKGGLSILAP